MILIYHPEGDQEPQRFSYDPNKLMSPEMEAIERATGVAFSEFTQAVLTGHAKCRRALLWVLLKRQHPTLRFEDVSFRWEELKLEFSKQEYQSMYDTIEKRDMPDNEKQDALDSIRLEMEDAHDDPEGKARPPIAV